jgi:DNA-binding NtrC family response regulator
VNVLDLPDKFHPMFRPPMFEEMEHPTDFAAATPYAILTAASPAPKRNSTMEFGERGVNLNEMVSTMERDLIMNALERTGGVKSRAAQLLGLNRTTLLEKMKKMGIEMQKR